MKSKFWFYITLLLSCWLGIPVAQAGNLNWIINGKAEHLGKPVDGTTSRFNENNWGFGFQYDYDLIDHKWLPFVTASGFSDSLHNPSFYGGGGYLRRYRVGIPAGHFLNLDVGGILFLMTREDFMHNNPFPGVLPVLSVGSDKVAVNITYIPKVHPKLVPLWFFQLKVSSSLFQ